MHIYCRSPTTTCTMPINFSGLEIFILQPLQLCKKKIFRISNSLYKTEIRNIPTSLNNLFNYKDILKFSHCQMPHV